MHCLFIDIASHQSLLACVSQAEIMASHAPDYRVADHELLPLVEQVLAKADWSYQDLTHLACVVGPGGFTSLRVAAAFANTVADQLSIPSAGVHLSDLYLARSDAADCLWLHSTKRDQLFVRGFGSLEKTWPEAVCLTLDEFLAAVPAETSWMGELIDEHQAAIQAKNLAVLSLKETAGILPDYLSELSYDQELLLPWYGRSW